MKHERSYALVSFIWLSAVTFVLVSTTVMIDSVGSLRDTGSVRCGSKVTFICFIPTYKYTMTWLIDSGKAAECTTTNCVQYPPYVIENVEFSTDTTNGVFNMTINPVTFKADGRVIKCEAGSDTVHVIPAVKVFPKQSTTTIMESKFDNHDMINITAMSGCVFPSSAITLQWYYYEAGETPKLYQMSSPTVSVLPICTSGNCGGDGVVQMSSTLSIPEVQTGREYYFQIAINHEDADSKDIVLVNSTRSYKIKQIPSKIAHATELPVIGIVVGALVAFLVMVSVVVVVSTVRRRLTTLRMNLLSADSTTNCMEPAIDNVKGKEEGSAKTALKYDRQASGLRMQNNIPRPLLESLKNAEEDQTPPVHPDKLSVNIEIKYDGGEICCEDIKQKYENKIKTEILKDMVKKRKLNEEE
ncbi:uncharacterized protein LOC123559778 isoform X2 [Mercenaria mercenaria]|uniref:uncharacterized protein LOC123559778 isoform X2 n=1 Tax=Mercenaria mercenaria TaxID=6596 RepID=UPI00234E66F7|nr:uncharacterized protein LOC123559778 isoform X2 [Mercenaria mercenaria]